MENQPLLFPALKLCPDLCKPLPILIVKYIKVDFYGYNLNAILSNTKFCSAGCLCSENFHACFACSGRRMPDIRYLALGDSYTIGESVAEYERWPNQLASLLQAND